jgi:hypothetical protein
MLLRALLAAAVVSCAVATGYPNSACQADGSNTFTFSVDFFVAQMGEFTVAGCEGTSPVLQLTPGITYTFVQSDPSNWFSPARLRLLPRRRALRTP